MLYSKDKVSFAIFQKIAAKKTVKTLVRSVCPKMAQQGSDFLLCWERGLQWDIFSLFGQKVYANDCKVWFAGYTLQPLEVLTRLKTNCL